MEHHDSSLRAHVGQPHWRHKLHEVIFEADTSLGKLFDVLLLIMILLSVLAVSLESVRSIDQKHHALLNGAEWFFTIAFTIEYMLRLLCVRHPLRYARSFFGVVDLLAILPTYVSLIIPGAQSLLVIRAIRLLRLFRIFKLARYLSEATSLRQALYASRAKITVFLATVLIIVVIVGASMHLIEGGQNEGFSSIPQSMYWAIVTMTTVGYGDVAPVTVAGKVLAAVMMIIGYSMIIVPTGILSAELATSAQRPVSTQACPSCSREGHAANARFCKFCGASL